MCQDVIISSVLTDKHSVAYVIDSWELINKNI